MRAIVPEPAPAAARLAAGGHAEEQGRQKKRALVRASARLRALAEPQALQNHTALDDNVCLAAACRSHTYDSSGGVTSYLLPAPNGRWIAGLDCQASSNAGVGPRQVARMVLRHIS